MSATERTGRLALEDGSIFTGAAFGAEGVAAQAEVVFNTAMCGYQEALTDPSYTGQILVMTAPLIGNYGVNDEDRESGRVQASGFVVRELARRASNFRASGGLSAYLASNNVPGLSGIDTRALTRRLRINGSLRGVLTDDASRSDAELVELARATPPMSGQNLAARAGVSENAAWNDDPPGGDAPTIYAIDCGAKHNIYRRLEAKGCRVVAAPRDIGAERVRSAWRAGACRGVLVTNGPGDPAAVEETVAWLRELLEGPAEACPPIFGICLGHQLLALAAGATTYKLKFGHRGVNQPVVNTLTERIEITSQNHGFAVDADSLGEHTVATHFNLNDGTLAGFRLKDRPVFAVQHHPEASPGPHDSDYLFDLFLDAVGGAAAPV